MRVELLQRAGRRVAWIGMCFSPLSAFLVDALEIGDAHVDLAAHTEERRDRASAGGRVVARRRRSGMARMVGAGGDIFAIDAIAARGPARRLPFRRSVPRVLSILART
jgi:hypothetical protein